MNILRVRVRNVRIEENHHVSFNGAAAGADIRRVCPELYSRADHHVIRQVLVTFSRAAGDTDNVIHGEGGSEVTVLAACVARRTIH